MFLQLQGMVMVSPEMDPTICWMFEAEIVLLFHAKTFHKGFQVTVHIGNVRQTATVEAVYGKVSSVILKSGFAMQCIALSRLCPTVPTFGLFLILSLLFLLWYATVPQEELRTGEKAVVLFKFIKHPEYLKVGAKVLFREGVTKGIGHVTKLQPITQYLPSQSEDEEAWIFFRPQQKTPSHPPITKRCFINHLLLSPNATLPCSLYSKSLSQNVVYHPFPKPCQLLPNLPSLAFYVIAYILICFWCWRLTSVASR